MPDFDTLLFDLDGTLVDSTSDLTTAINLLREELGLGPLDMATVASYVGDGAELLIRRSLPQGSYRQQHLQRFMDIYSDHLVDATTPFPGIVTLLETCQGRSMAVVTNKPLKPTLALLDRLNLKRFFPVVVGGDSTPCKKPAAEPVVAALAQLGRKAQRAIMIGDHRNDLLAGRAAGTATCFCRWGTGEPQDAGYDFAVATPAELLRLLSVSGSR